MNTGDVPSLKSSGGLSMTVRDWFAWSPGRETRQDWLAWAGREATQVSDERPTPALPMMLRRRATPVGQKALAAALACEGVEAARYILASRHGEYDRTVNILTSLAEGQQPSPAEFSMSVHHGLAGLLSIHTGNRLGHIAVAASLDSFGYGLLEAASCLADAPATPVLLLYFDAPLPESYAPFRLGAEANLPIAVALLLTAGGANQISIDCAANDADDGTDSLPEVFLKFLLTEAPTGAATGKHMVWRWNRVA